MKPLPVLCLLSIIGAANAQTHYKVLADNLEVGSATASKTLDSKGRLLTKVRVTLEWGEQRGGFTTLWLIDKSGRTISHLEDGYNLDHQRLRILVTFGANSIKVVRTENNATKTTTVKIPKGNLSNVANFWFIKTHPRPGATSTYLSFNPTEGKWTTRTSRYIGVAILPGTNVKGHHIRVPEGEMWLDDKGMSIREEYREPGYRFVLQRTSQK